MNRPTYIPPTVKSEEIVSKNAKLIQGAPPPLEDLERELGQLVTSGVVTEEVNDRIAVLRKAIEARKA